MTDYRAELDALKVPLQAGDIGNKQRIAALTNLCERLVAERESVTDIMGSLKQSLENADLRREANRLEEWFDRMSGSADAEVRSLATMALSGASVDEALGADPPEASELDAMRTRYENKPDTYALIDDLFAALEKVTRQRIAWAKSAGSWHAAFDVAEAQLEKVTAERNLRDETIRDFIDSPSGRDVLFLFSPEMLELCEQFAENTDPEERDVPRQCVRLALARIVELEAEVERLKLQLDVRYSEDDMARLDELQQENDRLRAALATELPEETTMKSPSPELIHEIARERVRQDAKWGGPIHDDSHLRADWGSFISDRAMEVQYARTDAARARRLLIEIAALAVAAIESCDRHANGTWVRQDGYAGPQPDEQEPVVDIMAALQNSLDAVNARRNATEQSDKERTAMLADIDASDEDD